MNDIFRKENLFLDCDISSKQELFSFVAEQLLKQNKINNKEQFISDLNKREKESPTGFENGIAIPHTQSESVNEAIVTVVRTNAPISDYESIMPSNEVRLIFIIAVPSSAAGDHIKILSSLATKLMDASLVKSLMGVTSDYFLPLLNNEAKESKVEKVVSGSKKIVAITACATGIAHTYMAAEAIEKKCAELGYSCKVEKQGAGGIEDQLTMQDINEADAVIFAHDVELVNLARFKDKKFIDVKVAKPLHDPDGVIENALNSNNTFIPGSEDTMGTENVSRKEEIMTAVMTGISHMIPVVVAGGVLMGIAKLSALFIGGDAMVQSLGTFVAVNEAGQLVMHENTLYVMLSMIDKFGSMVMKLMYPMFAAYVAYSLAGKNALLPGLIGGLCAQGLQWTLMGMPEMPAGIMGPILGVETLPTVPSGFIGALILGLVAGYTVKNLNKLKFSKNLMPLKTMLIIPSVSVLVVIFLDVIFIEPIFGGLNMWLQNLIMTYSSMEYLYAILVAGATAFDLGGPVNKAAGTVAMGLAADGTIAMTARTLAIVIPPIGLGVATAIDKIVARRSVFEDDERMVGQTSILLGVMAISEGAIPFMLKNPQIVIPINMIGAILGSIVAIALGAEMWLPIPAFWGWPLVEGSIAAYMIGMFVGVAFIAFANIFIRLHIIKKREKNLKLEE